MINVLYKENNKCPYYYCFMRGKIINVLIYVLYKDK